MNLMGYVGENLHYSYFYVGEKMNQKDVSSESKYVEVVSKKCIKRIHELMDTDYEGYTLTCVVNLDIESFGLTFKSKGKISISDIFYCGYYADRISMKVAENFGCEYIR